jgi:hypothetical protein
MDKLLDNEGETEKNDKAQPREKPSKVRVKIWQNTTQTVSGMRRLKGERTETVRCYNHGQKRCRCLCNLDKGKMPTTPTGRVRVRRVRLFFHFFKPLITLLSTSLDVHG